MHLSCAKAVWQAFIVLFPVAGISVLPMACFAALSLELIYQFSQLEWLITCCSFSYAEALLVLSFS